jgi:homoserine dehydrogenase
VCHNFTPEAGTIVSSDVNDVLNDPEIDIIVEAMGGTEPARTLMRDSKAHVVTANKALLAEALPELSRLFSRSPRSARRLGFEAAVAGGVPVIRALQSSLGADNLTSITGIMNGTTNFILSKMDAEGKSYASVLAEAQAAGFAEADPTADVEGHDARNKLVLLTALATGLFVPPAKIRTVGITAVSDWDFAALREQGLTIKLLGSMLMFAPAAEGATPSPPPMRLLDLFVSPSVVGRTSAFGLTAGPMNLIRTRGDSTGTLAFYGAGAGRFATANSVVSDMVNIAKGTASTVIPRPRPRKLGLTLKQSSETARGWYLRGPKDAVELTSVALWRQGRSIRPVGPAGGDTKAFMVDGVSFPELAGLARRVAAKATGSNLVMFPVDSSSNGW